VAGMQRDIRDCVVAVVGATGSVGSPCVDLLAGHKPKKLLLLARNVERLASRAEQVRAEYGVDVEWTTDLEDLRQADVVFVSASATTALLEPHVLKSGALVCDVSVPHAVSQSIFEKRPDVLVMEGGVVRIDERVMESFVIKPFTSPNGIQVSKLMPCSAYLSNGLLAACLAETFLVGLEGQFENIGLGTITAAQALEMEEIGRKHGMVAARERLTLFAELLQNPRLAEEALRRFVESRSVAAS